GGALRSLLPRPAEVAGCAGVVCEFFFFQAEDGIRDFHVTGVQTCALPIVSVCWAFRRFGTGLYNRRCAVLSNRSSSRISTRRVTGIVRDAVVITPSARRSCLSAATGVTGLWTWTCRNAATRSTMT